MKILIRWLKKAFDATGINSLPKHVSNYLIDNFTDLRTPDSQPVADHEDQTYFSQQSVYSSQAVQDVFNQLPAYDFLDFAERYYTHEGFKLYMLQTSGKSLQTYEQEIAVQIQKYGIEKELTMRLQSHDDMLNTLKKHGINYPGDWYLDKTKVVCGNIPATVDWHYVNYTKRSQATLSFLASNHIEIKKYSTFEADAPYRIATHERLVQNLDYVCLTYQQYGKMPVVKNICDLSCQVIESAYQANSKNENRTASWLSTMAHKLICLGRSFGDYAQAATHGAALGVKDAVLDTYHFAYGLKHEPKKTLLKVLQDVAHMGIFLARFSFVVIQCAPLFPGTWQEKVAHVYQECQPLLDWVQALKESGGPQATKMIMRLLVGQLVMQAVTHQGFKGFKNVCAAIKTEIAAAIKPALQPITASEIPAWFLERSQLRLAEQTAEVMENALQKGTKALEIAEREVELLSKFIFFEEEVEFLRQRVQTMTVYIKELNAQFSMKECFEHIFRPDFNKTGTDWTGLHHDWGGFLEKSGIIKFVKKKFLPDGGCKVGNVLIQGITKNKTFFPNHWTRLEVLEKIVESCKNIKHSRLLPNGEWRLIGVAEGIEIEIRGIIKNGIFEMRTAFLFLDKKI